MDDLLSVDYDASLEDRRMFESAAVLDARAHLRDSISKLQQNDMVGWVPYDRYVVNCRQTDAEVRERMLAGQIKFKRVGGKLLLLAT